MNDPRLDPEVAGTLGTIAPDAAWSDTSANRASTASSELVGGPSQDGPLEPPPAPPPSEAAARQWHDLPRPAVQPGPTGALFRSLSGLLAAYAVLMVGNGLFTTLIPIRMLHAGLSTVAVGLVQSCYYVGFVAGAMANSRLIERIGQHRAFVAFSAAAALTALAFGTFDSPWVGGVLRFCSGVAFMGVYACVESWLNGAVPNAMRGRVFSTYLAITYLGVGAGQFLLGAAGASGGGDLLIVGALFVGAILPVTLLEGWPVHVFEDRAGVQRPRSWFGNVVGLWRDTPLAIPGCVCAGLLSSAFYSMIPLFLTGIGFSVSELSHFMGIVLVGALLTQWPIGKLSDRVERRLLVFWIAALSAAFSMPLIIVRAHWFVGIATCGYVAMALALYGLIVSYVNDHVDANRRIAISATLLILFSIGGLSGPTIASVAMTVLGSSGLFVFNAATAALLAYVARRSITGGRATRPGTP